MSNRTVTVYQQPSSALPPKGAAGKPKHKANKSTAGSVAPRRAPLRPGLTKKELKKEIRKDLNLTKVMVDGRQRLLYTVPECTRHYISARADPFNTIGGACMPSSDFNFPSLKSKSVSSGTFRLGTTGVGYIAYLPAGANNSANIVTTGVSSVGTNATALSAFTNLITFNFANIPFAAADFGGNLLWRYVAGGIRVQYIGSLMNQNGNAFCYCDPDHSSVTNTQTVNGIGNTEVCRRIPITGSTMHQGGGTQQNWLCTVTDNGPVVPAEIAFTAASSVQATPYMVIAINGAAGDLYEFEVAQHSEWQGTTVPSMTPSEEDSTSWPVVDEVMKQSFNHGPPQPTEEKGILAKIGSALSEHLPKVVGSIGKGLAGLPAIVSGLMNLIPMTGSNPLIANQGFSYPQLMQHQARITSGHGRGSNLFNTQFDNFLRDLATVCLANKITPFALARSADPNCSDHHFSDSGQLFHYTKKMDVLCAAEHQPTEDDKRCVGGSRFNPGLPIAERKTYSFKDPTLPNGFGIRVTEPQKDLFEFEAVVEDSQELFKEWVKTESGRRLIAAYEAENASSDKRKSI